MCTTDEIQEVMGTVNAVTVKESVLGYMEDIVVLTRQEPRFVLGASPRALLALGYYFAASDTSFCVHYSQGGLVRQQVQGMMDFDGFYQRTAEVTFGEEGELPELLEQVGARGDFGTAASCFLCCII